MIVKWFTVNCVVWGGGEGEREHLNTHTSKTNNYVGYTFGKGKITKLKPNITP